MKYNDLYNSVVAKRGLSPSAGPSDNTAQVSQIIDTRGAEGVLFLIATGTLADADATFTVLVEDGDAANLSDAAAVPDTSLIGTNAAGAAPEAAASFIFSDDDAVRKIGYVPRKRYVRLTITPANNASAAPMAVIALLHGLRHLPQQHADGAAITQVP